MIRGTTPTHTFTLPFAGEGLKNLKITYVQMNKVVLSKYLDDVGIRGNCVTVRLSQKDTLSFKSTGLVQIQVRVVAADGTALASNIMEVPVERCLDSEVLA